MQKGKKVPLLRKELQAEDSEVWEGVWRAVEYY